MDSASLNVLPPKERLLVVAQELFGERDPADVSVRELARKAGVNIAAINYHYRSKEGLYRAVLERIATIMEEIFQRIQKEFLDEKSAFFQNEAVESVARERFYIRWYEKLLETIARTILSKHLEGNSMHKLMIREQMNGGEGFAMLYERLRFFFLLLDECLAEITQERGRKNILRVHALFGQIIIFVASSATVSRRLGIERFDKRDVEEMVEIILENTDAVLCCVSRKEKEV